jgi:hypothetical protein
LAKQTGWKLGAVSGMKLLSTVGGHPSDDFGLHSQLFLHLPHFLDSPQSEALGMISSLALKRTAEADEVEGLS